MQVCIIYEGRATAYRAMLMSSALRMRMRPCRAAMEQIAFITATATTIAK